MVKAVDANTAYKKSDFKEAFKLYSELCSSSYLDSCDKKREIEKLMANIFPKPSRSNCENNGGKWRDNECYANWDNGNKICASGMPTIEQWRIVLSSCKNDKDCLLDKGYIAFSKYRKCWSSSIFNISTNDAWYVGFYYGNDLWSDKFNSGYIRCIGYEE